MEVGIVESGHVFQTLRRGSLVLGFNLIPRSLDENKLDEWRIHLLKD
jgi:hypothetical protein